MAKNNSTVTFEKMHGVGNDFIVMDARDAHFPMNEIVKRTPQLCHRKTGIGADGILMLGESDSCDYTMYYWNADGSEAGMCGNGARCMAMFAVQRGFPRQLTFCVHDIEYRAEVNPDYVSVYFPVNPEPVEQRIDDLDWYVLNTGTEHVVSINDSFASTPEETFRKTGRSIRNRTDLFPSGTNVNFAHVINENRLKLVTYERGVEDLTLACGTGAIATAVAWQHHKTRMSHTAIPDSLEHHIQVDCQGGPLEVTFDVLRNQDNYLYQNIALHGPAVSVYKGTFPL